VDAESGTALPLATLTWSEEGRRQGVTTTESGRFQLRLDGPLATRSALTLRVSYVGYETTPVHVDLTAPPTDLTVRLSPSDARAPEVVVESYALRTSLEGPLRSLVRAEHTAGLGEENVLRALQPLPAVSLSPAFVEGLSVRGSRTDGFGVLLDGVPIYNQTHLFGLVDAFNAEALQTVGLYYGVVPVEYPAPPGGTLAFRTRTGAQTGARAGVDLSPIAVSGTLEGPLADGQGSWLVSARRSLLELNWFGADALVAQGLGTDRRTEAPAGGKELSDLLYRPGAPSAHFYDVHAKGLWERPDGARWILSGYAGGDVAAQGGRRLERDDAPTLRERLRGDRVDTTAVRSTYRWGNVGASLTWEHPIGAGISSLTVAASRYYSRYSTDQFLYLNGPSTGRPRFEVGAFAHENDLVDLRLTHRVELSTGVGDWTLGSEARRYDVSYEEASAVRSDFQGTSESVQVDLFGAYARALGPLSIEAGLRTHYYSPGTHVLWSPRLRVELGPDAPVTVGLGYTRNHQFLHRLHLDGETGSAVWVPSTERQPPGRSDHVMASVALRPAPRATLQVEAFWKRHDDLRRHSSLARLVGTGPSVLLQPWTVENRSVARGVEAMLRYETGRLAASAAYTVSRVTLTPAGPAEPRPADWDRRHQVTARVEWTPATRITAFATWALATGPPNRFAGVDGEADRLDPYHRLDLGGRLQGRAGPVRWALRGTVFNAYDRDNPWHRTAVGLLRRDGPDRDRRPELDFALVDVYDLGVRPSVSLSLSW
jgi:hypothetical protein